MTSDRDGMLREVPCVPRLEAVDVNAYINLQRVSRALKQPDTLEYWKSSPYLLNFMEGYALKNALVGAGEGALHDALRPNRATEGVLLPWSAIRSYGPVESANPRMRVLAEQTVETDAWQALWLPPSLPYYELAGAFAAMEKAVFTKRLVFSSW